MTKPLFVGVGYKKDRGKDTLCDMMINHIMCTYPKITVSKIGFADKVKDIAHQLYGWAGVCSGSYYDEPANYPEKEVVLPKIGVSPRDVWIHIGNGMRDLYGPTWIDYVLNSAKTDIVFIKDLGFKNEANCIRNDHGGVLVRVDREGKPLASDARETELDDWPAWDCCVANHYGKDELLNPARRLAGCLVEKLADRVY
jgi:hypothetical protein